MATTTQPATRQDASGTTRDQATDRGATRSLEALGITAAGAVHWNNVSPELVQEAIRRGEGRLADMGPFVAVTAPHTGRSPNDKFVVREPESENDVDWGKVNQPIAEEKFDALLADVQAYLGTLPELFVQDLYCGADERHQLKVRYVLPNAWHAMFVRNMFIRPDDAALAGFEANFTVLHAPEFQASPERHGTWFGM
jgi:phosphoenolpyruvate carboxykinase (ATP)